MAFFHCPSNSIIQPSAYIECRAQFRDQLMPLKVPILHLGELRHLITIACLTLYIYHNYLIKHSTFSDDISTINHYFAMLLLPIHLSHHTSCCLSL